MTPVGRNGSGRIGAFLRWMQPGLITFGTFWGVTPRIEWIFPEAGLPPEAAPGRGHPERLVGHLPLSPVEQALWAQLVAGEAVIAESDPHD